MFPTADDYRRFWAKVSPEPGLGSCWVWTASKVHGYGSFGGGRKTYRAHRVAYQQHVGPVPAGLVLDHLCRNKACVNPAHLEAVTQKENLRRGVWTHISRPGAKKPPRPLPSHCSHGHPMTPENIYIQRGCTRLCRVCIRRSRKKWKASQRAKEVSRG